jgi:hypothetical protein
MWLTSGSQVCGSASTLIAFHRTLSLSWRVDAVMDHKEFLNRPVEYVVMLKTLAYEEIAEKFAKIGVIRLVIKPQIADILDVGCEFLWEVTAKVVDRGVYLRIFNTLVSLVLCCRLQALPGQRAAGKVNHHISKRFEIIAAGLL